MRIIILMMKKILIMSTKATMKLNLKNKGKTLKNKTIKIIGIYELAKFYD